MIKAWMFSKQYWFGGLAYSGVLIKQRGSNNSGFSCKSSMNIDSTELFITADFLFCQQILYWQTWGKIKPIWWSNVEIYLHIWPPNWFDVLFHVHHRILTESMNEWQFFSTFDAMSRWLHFWESVHATTHFSDTLNYLKWSDWIGPWASSDWKCPTFFYDLNMTFHIKFAAGYYRCA